jgi:hypothetical protein
MPGVQQMLKHPYTVQGQGKPPLPCRDGSSGVRVWQDPGVGKPTITGSGSGVKRRTGFKEASEAEVPCGFHHRLLGIG